MTFEPPVPFTQYDGNCDGDIMYTGNVQSIRKLEYGSFCVADEISNGDETVNSYSKVDIVKCDANNIYENWSECTDDTCGDCEESYQAHTDWASINPEPIVGYCYDYTFSLDPVEKMARKAAGTFINTREVNFKFDEDANAGDAKAYVEMMDGNSCIAYGQPDPEQSGTEVAQDDSNKQTEEINEDDSGASALATTATIVLAAATIVLLA